MAVTSSAHPAKNTDNNAIIRSVLMESSTTSSIVDNAGAGVSGASRAANERTAEASAGCGPSTRTTAWKDGFFCSSCMMGTYPIGAAGARIYLYLVSPTTATTS